MHFGPVRHASEPLSAFKWRQARFAAAWLFVLGGSLLLVSIAGVSPQQTSFPGAVLFLYFGLGTGMAWSLYLFVQGVIKLEAAHVLGRRGPSTVTWSGDPVMFLLDMGVLAGLGFVLPVVVLRKLGSRGRPGPCV